MDLRRIFDRFPTALSPNESQTEDDLIWPVLSRLGWTESLRQQNLAPRGREDVPDGLLFGESAAKARANTFPEEWRRYEFGLAVVESKRWRRPLDRRSGRRGEETAPSTQMLRYLRRVEDLTTGKLRWGMLTNGGQWRLYYQGARSVSEQFFETDLPAVLAIPGHDGGLFALTEEAGRHWLRVFALIFGRAAFLPTPSDNRTFHQRALEEGRFYEERVATNLSNLVFGQVFPQLARAIAAAAPDSPLQGVREAALILLYRLLFILYAEDRDLLPVRDSRYGDYGLRERVRGDVGRRKTATIPSRIPRRAIGRRSTTSAARSTRAICLSGCRHTMAACSMPSAPRCSRRSDSATRSWQAWLTPSPSSARPMGANTLIIAISASSSSDRFMSVCWSMKSFASKARSSSAPMSSPEKDRAATTPRMTLSG